jgi:hypothetical protein
MSQVPDRLAPRSDAREEGLKLVRAASDRGLTVRAHPGGRSARLDLREHACPLIGDGQVGEVWGFGEYVCLHGFHPFLAARVLLAGAGLLLAFEHGQNVPANR